MASGAAVAAAAPAGPPPRRSLARRLAFRFVFVYLGLYTLPQALDLSPATGSLAAPFFRFWQALLPWVASRLLHLRTPMATLPEGGGDSTTGAVFVLCMVLVAALAALLWALLDRRGRHDRALAAGLRVYLRYNLAYALLYYGIAKLIKTQFIFPAPTRLAEVYGDASPLGLLWTFMGYSTPYNVFTGLVEAAAGWLLLFRRTVTAGALLAAASMANVVAIDFSYDVPVKNWASHLLLIALVLLVPDLRRLADLLLFRRPTPALAPPERRRGPRWLQLAGRAAKALLITFLVLAIVRERYGLWKTLDRLQVRRQASPVSFYVVDAFLRNGRLVPAWPADPGRWQWLNVYGSQASVVLTSYESLAAAYDPTRRVLTLYGAGHRQLGELACSTSDAGVLVAAGKVGNDSLAVTLARIDPSRFLLMRHRFHWIEEAPLVR